MSEMNITLREATPKDAKELLAVMNILDKETPYLLVNQQSLTLEPEEMARQIDFIYEADNQLILLAYNNEDIIGVATVMADTDEPLKHIGEIGISILQAYWNLGLGTVMLEEIIEWAKEASIIKRLEIKVQERNERAIHLYQKLDFKTEGVMEYAFLSENNEYLNVVMMSLVFK